MNITTISGLARSLHRYIFDDRLCIGAYDVDIHFMNSCPYMCEERAICTVLF